MACLEFRDGAYVDVRIALLVHQALGFVGRYATKIGRPITQVASDAMQRLMAYPWPGNVRELENVIERAVILSPGPALMVPPEALPVTAAPEPPAPPAVESPTESRGALREVERQHIVAVLKQTGWRIDGPQGAARVLGLHPSTLRSRIQKLGIQRSADVS